MLGIEEFLSRMAVRDLEDCCFCCSYKRVRVLSFSLSPWCGFKSFSEVILDRVETGIFTESIIVNQTWP